MRYDQLFDIIVSSRPWCGKTWTRWRVVVKGTTLTAGSWEGSYDEATGRSLAIAEAKRLARVVRAVNRLGGAK